MYIPYSGKICRREFHDFALEQAFCGINFAICVLVFHVCIVILTISQINFREFSQIAKHSKYKPRENFPLYGMYVHTYVYCTVCMLYSQYKYFYVLLYRVSCSISVCMCNVVQYIHMYAYVYVHVCTPTYVRKLPVASSFKIIVTKMKKCFRKGVYKSEAKVLMAAKNQSKKPSLKAIYKSKAKVKIPLIVLRQ